VLRYADIRHGLPRLARGDGVRGILTWFSSDDLPDADAYLAWLAKAFALGKRVTVFGSLGVADDRDGRPLPPARINALLAHLGVRAEDRTITLTYPYRVARADPHLYNYERRLGGPLPSFKQTRVYGADARSYLRVERANDPGDYADLVVIGPAGAYVAPGYGYYSPARVAAGKWYLNPFAFFRLAFATAGLPKPDTTTLSGRRIYYSHIYGDGWRNGSEIKRYRKRHALASEVILEEAIRPFPDLPVSVAPIAADLDPAWSGSAETRRIARALFALPQVEAASHTYSHPFTWKFFEHYTPAKERPLLADYPELRKRLDRGLPVWGIPASKFARRGDKQRVIHGYSADLPRAYARKPFSLDREIQGSIDYLNTLTPPGKRVRLLQWSGDTSPFEAALAAAEAAGVRNMNGGDSRFDKDFPSHAWVAPLGRRVGRYWQVYSSNSNENTYTEEWSKRYFGFKFLPATLEATESPVRLKPINIYYHIYSGAKVASLKALLGNLAYARRQEIAPIAASRYAAIVNGFFRARIVPLGPRRWRIEDRDGLQTLRFDDASAETVDLARSTGVIGWRGYQGSLYVALDAAVRAPVVALRQGAPDAAAGRPYLIDARWRVYGLQTRADGMRFETRGFGRGRMNWRVTPGSDYRLQIEEPHGGRRRITARADRHGVLSVDLGADGITPLTVDLRAGAPAE